MPLYGVIIVIKRSGADGSEFPLTTEGGCLLGSDDSCDIRIRLPSVEPFHCRLKSVAIPIKKEDGNNVAVAVENDGENKESEGNNHGNDGSGDGIKAEDVETEKEVYIINNSSTEPVQLNGEDLAIGDEIKLKEDDVFTVVDRSFRFVTSVTYLRLRSQQIASTMTTTTAATGGEEEDVLVSSPNSNLTSVESSEVSEKDQFTTPKSKVGTPSLFSTTKKGSVRKTPSQKDATPRLWTANKKENRRSSIKNGPTTSRIPKFGVTKLPASTSKLQKPASTSKIQKATSSASLKIPRSASSAIKLRKVSSMKEQKSPAVGSKVPKTPQQSTNDDGDNVFAIGKVQATPKSIGKPPRASKPTTAAASSGDKTPRFQGIRRLLREKEEAVATAMATPKMDGLSTLFQSAKRPEATPKLDGVSTLFQAAKSPTRSAMIPQIVVSSPSLFGGSDIDSPAKVSPTAADASPTTAVVAKSPSSIGGSKSFNGETPTKTPRNGGVRRLLSEEKETMASPKLSGVRRLMMEEDNEGTTSATPRFGGLRRMMDEANESESDAQGAPTPKFAGIRRLMEEPEEAPSPKVGGIRRLMEEPAVATRSPKVGGIRRLMEEPTEEPPSPRLSGIRSLMNEKANNGAGTASPRLAGIRSMMRETAAEGQAASPNLSGVRSMLRESIGEDQASLNLSGIRLMMEDANEKRKDEEKITDETNDEAQVETTKPKTRRGRAAATTTKQESSTPAPPIGRTTRSRKASTQETDEPPAEIVAPKKTTRSRKATPQQADEPPVEVVAPKKTTRSRRDSSHEPPVGFFQVVEKPTRGRAKKATKPAAVAANVDDEEPAPRAKRSKKEQPTKPTDLPTNTAIVETEIVVEPRKTSRAARKTAKDAPPADENLTATGRKTTKVAKEPPPAVEDAIAATVSRKTTRAAKKPTEPASIKKPRGKRAADREESSPPPVRVTRSRKVAN